MGHSSPFERSFRDKARSVRARLALRGALGGLAAGTLLGVALTALLWWLGHGALRPWAAAGIAAVGATAGLLWSRRRRWSDTDVALYLDARLDAREAISTAVELRGQPPTAASRVIVRDASVALTSANPRAARPRVFERWHGLTPLGGALAVWLCWIPLPPSPPVPPEAPGASNVKVADLRGLAKIVALDHLDPRDAEQRRRLHDIAERARRLRAKLAQGMPKRSALAQIAKLRDDIAAERLNLGNRHNRAGTDAAVRKLAEDPALSDAARALEDGDLTRFDREMQKLANRVEKKDRKKAEQALEDAAKAARARGAKGLGKALEDEKKRFKEREAGAEALRDLARQVEGKLSKQAQEDLDEFGQTGSPEARKRLADALGKAITGLDDAARKRLAERLKKQLAEHKGAASPMTKQQIDDLAKELSTPEGQRRLAEQLRKLASPDPSGAARRQRGLDEADRGGAQAQRGLGGLTPIPMADNGSPSSGASKPGASNRHSNKGTSSAGGPGSHHDTGTGEHSGHTGQIAAGQLRAKANAPFNPGGPIYGATLGRAPARPGETANQMGTGALGRVGPTEVGGVERSQVPEEYREQVSRYFHP